MDEAKLLRVAGQLFEVPLFVEGLGQLRQAIQDHGHEGKRTTGFLAIAERPGEEMPAESLLLVGCGNTEPCQQSDGCVTGAAPVMCAVPPGENRYRAAGGHRIGQEANSETGRQLEVHPWDL